MGHAFLLERLRRSIRSQCSGRFLAIVREQHVTNVRSMNTEFHSRYIPLLKNITKAQL